MHHLLTKKLLTPLLTDTDEEDVKERHQTASVRTNEKTTDFRGNHANVDDSPQKIGGGFRGLHGIHIFVDGFEVAAMTD